MLLRVALTGLLMLSASASADNVFSSPQSFIKDDGSRLVIASGFERDGLSLYSLSSTGKDKRLLVKASVRGRGDYEPAVSPDGKKLAFTTYRYGGWKVAVSDIDGSNVRRVTLDPQYAYDPHWSPDGKSLVYRRIVPNGSAYWRGQADIYRINVDGSDNRNISNTGKDGDRKAAYSPDGLWVVYDSFKNNDGKALWIMLMKSDGSQLKRIESGSDMMFAPSWSPDGKWIAHLREDKAGYIDLWVMKTDGSEARNLSQSRKRGLAKAGDRIGHWQYDTNWAVGGDYITFVANYADKDNIDIYAVDLKGKHIARLTHGKEDDVHPYSYWRK